MKNEIRIEILNKSLEDSYEKFLAEISHSLLYHSNKYRLFLKDLLHNSDDFYLLAITKGEVVGALPLFVKKNEKYGNVLNSLPFYGSHGSLLLKDGPEKPQIIEMLIGKFESLIVEEKIAAATIIENPFDDSMEKSYLHCKHLDSRIGQFVDLGAVAQNQEAEHQLMSLFHSKTRNMVRKSLKEVSDIRINYSEQAWNFLVDTHKSNIREVGGVYKEKKVFDSIRKNFHQGADYELWTANVGENLAAALLIFYFKNTVEYFTPCIDSSYRSLQPLSGIIFKAMMSAVERGCRTWNWGGTWETQSGVYLFKSRWGTTDKKYMYYTNVYDENIYNLSKEILLAEYENFYVLPFKELKP